MTAFVDIHKDITRFVATVPLHIVLDSLRAEGFVVSISESQCRALGLVEIHGEVASLSQSPTLPCAIVIHLTISQTIGQLFVATLVLHRLWFHLFEGDEMTELHTHEEFGISRHRDGVVGSLRNSARDIDTSSQRTLSIERHVVLGLMSLTGN